MRLLLKSHNNEFFNFSPLTLNPFPPKGARDVIAPQSLPAPFGGRMSEGQIGGCFKYGLLQKAIIFVLFLFCILAGSTGDITVSAQNAVPGDKSKIGAGSDARLDSVKVVGIDGISPSDLDRILLSKSGGILNDGLIGHDRDALAEYLHEQGWWSASVVSELDSTKDRTLLTYRIMAGQRVRFGRIILDMPEKERANMEEPQSNFYGKPFTRPVLDSLSQKIVSRLADNGFPDAMINPKLEAHEDTINVSLQIRTGAKASIDSIEFNGLTVTKNTTVRRELRDFYGRQISVEMLAEARSLIGRLKFLRLAQEPSIEYTPAGKGILVLNLEEGSQGTFDGVLGYQPSVGGNGSGEMVGKIDLGLPNLFGTGRTTRVLWENMGNKSSDLELLYNEPWVLGYPVDITGAFSQEDRQAQGYSRTLFSASAGRTLGRLAASAGFRYEKVSSDSIRSYGATGIQAGISWNSVDNPANPRSGVRYSANWSMIVKNYRFGAGEKTNLKRAELGFDNYIPTTVHQSIAVMLSYRDVTTGNGLLDPSDRYWLGGASTLRGYRERIFPAVRALISSFEYRFLTGETSRVFVFVDSGYLQDKVISGGNVVTQPLTRVGYGFGLRIQSRAGILGFDYGLGKGDSPGEGKLHVRLSTEF
jgi:outer membrane protein assembly factor BamA